MFVITVMYLQITKIIYSFQNKSRYLDVDCVDFFSGRDDPGFLTGEKLCEKPCKIEEIFESYVMGVSHGSATVVNIFMTTGFQKPKSSTHW